MGLLERAIDAYKEDQKLTKEENERATEEFAKKALERLNEILIEKDGSPYYSGEIEIIDKCPGFTRFRADGIIFAVAHSRGYYNVSVVRICPICETEYYTNVLDLIDIGKVFKEAHDEYDCKENIRKKDGPKVLSTEERLTEALRDFIQENDHMCSHVD